MAIETDEFLQYWDPTEDRTAGGDGGNDDGPGAPKRWWISMDESGNTGGLRYHGFGLLWMPDQRRGDFAKLIGDTMLATGYRVDCTFKWNAINDNSLDFYKLLVDRFFDTSWLQFDCIVFDSHVVGVPAQDKYNSQLGKRLHLLLTNKIRARIKAHRGRLHTFRIWADRPPFGYRKADETLHVIANNSLANTVGARPIDRVITRESRRSPSILLCDVLLGAVLSDWEGIVKKPSKLAVRAHIAKRAGWHDLHGDTWPGETKLNVWYYQDPRARVLASPRTVQPTP